MRVPIHTVVLSCVLAVAGCFSSSAAAQNPSGPTDPKVQAALTEGVQLMRQRQFAFAADDFKKANKLAGGRCLECLKALYAAQMRGGRYKDAADTGGAMEALAVTPPAHSVAEYYRANALFQAAGDKPKPEKLEALHTLLGQALAQYPQTRLPFTWTAQCWPIWAGWRRPRRSSPDA